MGSQPKLLDSAFFFGGKADLTKVTFYYLVVDMPLKLVNLEQSIYKIGLVVKYFFMHA
jgi:hypothetical protein